MTDPAWIHPDPLPPACEAGTCVCPTTTDGTDQQHVAPPEETLELVDADGTRYHFDVTAPAAKPPAPFTAGGIPGIPIGRVRVVEDDHGVYGIPIIRDDHLPPDLVLLRGLTDVYVRLNRTPLAAAASNEPADAGPMVCAECGTSHARTYVVTFTGEQGDPTGRTEVCEPCSAAFHTAEEKAYRAGWDAAAAKVAAYFSDGGPDTPLRTTWRGSAAAFSAERIECVEVPMDDLRALLDDISQP